MTPIGADRRVVDAVTTAWFEAPSLSAGAALAGGILGRSPEIAIDLRPTGVRVRLDSDDHAAAVAAAAAELGLTADPAALQQLSVVIDAADQTGVTDFWRRVLDYESRDDGSLADP